MAQPATLGTPLTSAELQALGVGTFAPEPDEEEITDPQPGLVCTMCGLTLQDGEPSGPSYRPYGCDHWYVAADSPEGRVILGQPPVGDCCPPGVHDDDPAPEDLMDPATRRAYLGLPEDTDG